MVNTVQLQLLSMRSSERMMIFLHFKSQAKPSHAKDDTHKYEKFNDANRLFHITPHGNVKCSHSPKRNEICYNFDAM